MPEAISWYEFVLPSLVAVGFVVAVGYYLVGVLRGRRAQVYELGTSLVVHRRSLGSRSFGLSLAFILPGMPLSLAIQGFASGHFVWGTLLAVIACGAAWGAIHTLRRDLDPRAEIDLARDRVRYRGKSWRTSPLSSHPTEPPCIAMEVPLERFVKVLVDKARGLGKDARAPYFPVGLGFAEGTTPIGFSEMFVTTSAEQAAVVARSIARVTHLPIAIEPLARLDANLTAALAATADAIGEGHRHPDGHPLRGESD
jgi:hypothetical protein